MEKKKINSFLLGIIVAINAFLVANLLQFLVVDNCIDALYNTGFAISESTSYDVLIATLTSNTLKVSLITKLIYFVREAIIFIEVYFLIKFLGKKFYISILKLQNTLITMFVVEMIPSIYKMTQGISLRLNSVLYLIFSILVYFAFMYNFLVDKEEADKIIELREKNREEKRRKMNKAKKAKKQK